MDNKEIKKENLERIIETKIDSKIKQIKNNDKDISSIFDICQLNLLRDRLEKGELKYD